MYENRDGIAVIWCDGQCNTKIDCGARRIQAANLVVRARGWRLYPVRRHYCPACSQKIPIKLAADRAEHRVKQPWEKWR